MKKTYIRPITEKIATEVAQLICASKPYTLKRYGQWGASSDVDYGNNAWMVEGFKDEAVSVGGRFEAVEMGGDDYNDYESRSNEGLW